MIINVNFQRGDVRDKIMFELEKKDARLILDKLSAFDQILLNINQQ